MWDDSVERVLRWLLRGGTWEGLANELAWKAVHATGASVACLEWLPGVVGDALWERIEELESVIASAGTAARAEHLREWPNDANGAETAAEVAADEEGARHVSAMYQEVLVWASELLGGRLEQEPGLRGARLSPFRVPAATEEPELPAVVAERLAGGGPRYGWPRRRRDDGRRRAA